MKISDNNYKSYNDIIKNCKYLGVEITWRKLNYYKSLNLLPKAHRIKGDKRGFYSGRITQVLIVYNFLQNHLGFTLKEIKREIEGGLRSKGTIDERIILFANWIDLTYRYFLDMFFDKTKTLATSIGWDEGWGATTITFANSMYKKALLQSSIPLGTSRHDLAEFAPKAKAWAIATIDKYGKVLEETAKEMLLKKK